MFDVPSVPTESLYKFSALVGVISILATAALFVTEIRDVEIENIKLTTHLNMYGKNVKKYIKSADEIVDEYRASTKVYKQQLNTAKQAKANADKKHKIVEFNLGKNKYSFDEYQRYLIIQMGKSGDTYLAKTRALEKIDDANTTEEIKITEQKSLLALNRLYAEEIKLLTTVVIVCGFFISVYGFYKWHQMQSISDELSLMELKKARKEAEKESASTATS